MSYKFLEHTADIKFLVEGETIEELFIESSKALIETIVGKTKSITKLKKEISLKGEDIENLLYQFLEEIIFLIDGEGFLTLSIENLKIKDNNLKATLIGDNVKKYKSLNDVKAITYNSMSIKKLNNKYSTEIVLDV